MPSTVNTYPAVCPNCNTSVELQREHLGIPLDCLTCGHTFKYDEPLRVEREEQRRIVAQEQDAARAQAMLIRLEKKEARERAKQDRTVKKEKELGESESTEKAVPGRQEFWIAWKNKNPNLGQSQLAIIGLACIVPFVVVLIVAWLFPAPSNPSELRIYIFQISAFMGFVGLLVLLAALALKFMAFMNADDNYGKPLVVHAPIPVHETDDAAVCPFCRETIKKESLKCRYCGEFFGPKAANMIVATKRNNDQATMCGVVALLVVAWGVVQAVIPWMAEYEGIISPLMPIWNSVFVCAEIMIAVGVFQGKEWARRWLLGICILNGAGNVLWAIESEYAIIWIGVIVQSIGAIVAYSAKRHFIQGSQRTTFDKLGVSLSAVAILGSFFIAFIVAGQNGTEKGRQNFIRELQAEYDRNVPGLVTVKAEGRTVVIFSPNDPTESVIAAAEDIDRRLKQSGRQAKAWLVGFTSIKITNGRYTSECRPK